MMSGRMSAPWGVHYQFVSECRDSLKMSSRGLDKNVPCWRGREAAARHERTFADEPEGATSDSGAGRG